MTNLLFEPPVAPYLVVNDGRAAIDFYTRAFGAELLTEQAAPDGKRVLHASLSLNGGVVHLSDDFPDMNDGHARDPHTLGDSPVTVALTLADTDALWEQDVEAGATVAIPLEDQFWGSRYGVLIDPFGHRWSIATPQAAVSDEQRARGAAAIFDEEE
jgi:PhnB protein